jgi:hypothetical protein
MRAAMPPLNNLKDAKDSKNPQQEKIGIFSFNEVAFYEDTNGSRNGGS